jgi:tetratricopeptide (TPR) repeat protein
MARERRHERQDERAAPPGHESPRPAAQRVAASVGNAAFARFADPGSGILPGGRVHPDVAAAIAAARGQGSALDGAVRDRVGAALNDSLGDVRVHADDHADALARSVSARAFTTGSDIFFARGEYRPSTTSGDALLAHELTHVVQQRGAAASAAPVRPVRVHDTLPPSGMPRIAPERAKRRTLPPLSRPAPVNPAPEIKQVGEAGRGGRITTARDHIQQLVQARPLEVDGHLLLGMLLLDEGAIEAAVDSLRRARFLDDDNALAHFGLGQAYLHQGDTAQARAAFTRARRILAAAPDDEAIAGGGDMSARELRYAIDAQLVSLGQLRAS